MTRWEPTAAHLERSRLLELCRRTGHADRTQLDAWATAQPGDFWGTVSDWLCLRWQKLPETVVTGLDTPESARWFPGGELNLVETALHRWVDEGRGEALALAWVAEDGSGGQWTFAELLAETGRVAAGLGVAGIGFGDRVGVQVSMRPEAAVAQLALAWVGAIAVPVFSGFGASAVVDRLRLAGARALVVSDAVTRRGRPRDLRRQTAVVLADLPGVEVCITLPEPGHEPGPPLRGELSWAELRERGAGREAPVADCPSDHVLMVAFTSGTTGQPKGIALTHVGFAIKAGLDAAICLDAGPGDVAAWVTDPGWVMHPITLLGGLVAGSAVGLIDGTPDHPSPTRLWEAVDALGVTVLGVSPTLVRGLMAQNATPHTPLPALRVMASSGEPWTEDAYLWLHHEVGGGRLPIINYSGGTEVSGAILSNTVTEPIEPCAFSGPVPGMGASIADADGRPLSHGQGELVLTIPSPGMPAGFWGEPGRYESTYWERWPRTWHHGDWVERTTEGSWFIHGRSDDTLKIAGKRLGPAEVENVVNALNDVLESAAIGVPDALTGSALVVYARVRSGVDHAAVAAKVSERVAAGLGKPLRPRAVHVVEDLPRTRSGKILRRLIHDAHLGRPVDLTSSSLANPAALALIGEH